MMKNYPKTTVTISREGDKLVIIRKPVLRTWRERLSTWFWRILILTFLIRLVSGYLYANVDRELGEVFQVVSIIAAVSLIIILVWRELTAAHPVKSWVEIVTFETDKFSLQGFGDVTVSIFSYRFDSRPVLRPNPAWPNLVDILIPCVPLDDHVTSAFQWGFCGIWFVDATDAERILATLKEHLVAIEPFQKPISAVE